ncbi:MAG: N-acetylneuraminate synthase [Deltaproteobacteria bacterium]|uniref:N-acetylneuraminate synthase n=1 Tax=Candidatus Zymogenus saltonus TaxID=2844893 RepID=A0A9D8KD20_9DELT|nr:N-acetylneuraminate synthase [Candidatus Zymogenus saltonus]
MKINEIVIGGRKIGHKNRCFIIAEAGVNHNGEMALAEMLIDAALDAGADAVKFQTFKAERVISKSAPKADYQKKATDPNETQLEMARRLELSFDNFRELKALCDGKGIIFLSSPFDEPSVDFLDEIGVPAFKVASGEITNLPFLEYIAKKGKPVILSTGMSYLGEVEEALRTIMGAGTREVSLLHCVTDYPADPEDSNLAAIQTMKRAFSVPIGYSDHTLGTAVTIAAVALGACIVEKHFTLDKTMPGPDHTASLEPRELKAMVDEIRGVEGAIGDGVKEPRESEEKNRIVGRRSVAAAVKIKEGTPITQGMLTALRPAGGISPKHLPWVIGKKARHDIESGEIITKDMIY